MRRYNIENRKVARECMDDDYQPDLSGEGGPTFSELSGEGGVLGALFMTAFGSPFLGAGLFTLVAGVGILLNEGLEGLFLIIFSLPFIGVGGMIVFGGLYNIGIGIGIIRQNDTLSTPPTNIQSQSQTFLGISSESVVFSNPLVINTESLKKEISLEKSNELPREVVDLLSSSKEFWVLQLSPGERFFQMHIESGLIEYWVDGAMQHQETGNIDDALKYLESIIFEEDVQQSEDLVDVFKQQLEHSIQQQELDFQLDNEIKSASEHLVKDSETIQTHSGIGIGSRLRVLLNNGFPVLVFILFGLYFFTPLGAIMDEVFEEEMPDTWCDGTNHYPVTVPITMQSELVADYDTFNEETMSERMDNRNTNTDSKMELAINGGVCNYQYRVGDTQNFEFTYRLDHVTNIDGVSILVMDHPLGLTNGYSGVTIETTTDNGSNWELQYSSRFMFGEYERGATFEEVHENFSYNEWYRHQFDKTVSNVTHVRLITAIADQSEDSAVSFSALRIDAEGDYDYPDYRLCNATWDGRFVNSTSDMIEWPVVGSLGC